MQFILPLLSGMRACGFLFSCQRSCHSECMFHKASLRARGTVGVNRSIDSKHMWSPQERNEMPWVPKPFTVWMQERKEDTLCVGRREERQSLNSGVWRAALNWGRKWKRVTLSYTSIIVVVQSLSQVQLFAPQGLQHARLPCPSLSP